MSKQQRLTQEQDEIRLRGLRILARMLARAHLDSVAEDAPGTDGEEADGPDGPGQGRTLPTRTVSMSGKRPLVRARLNAAAVWDLLHRLNMTKNELASWTGLATGYLSQLLNGKRNPSAATRKRLQDVLEVGFDELFILEGGDGE